MAIEPVKIPQNVYVEDRIVGPITLRQLIIVMLTGGFSYALWTGIKSSTGYASVPLTIICWIPALIGAAFAFVKIQNISLFRLCLLMIEKTDKPTIRKWSPRRGISINFRYFSAKEDEKERKKKAQEQRQPHHERLEELSAMLDRGPIALIATAPTEEEPQNDLTPAAEHELSPAPRPVDPERVSADARKEHAELFDGFMPPSPAAPKSSDSSPKSAQPLVRDILPPT